MSESKKIGRPSKKDISAKKAGGRGQVGRPKGDAAIINEYKARMLNSPRSQKVIDAIYDAALDSEHKNQAACMKLLVDRILPISHFEKDRADKAISGISITINSANPDNVKVGSDIEDADYEEVE